MGECGCMMNNESYRLPKKGDTFYIIELYAGCRNCSGGPGILIREVNRQSWDWEEARHCQLLPMFKTDAGMEAPIRCGPDPDEFKKLGIPAIAGYEVDKRRQLDRDDADVLLDEVWNEAINVRPEVVLATGTKR